MHYLVCIYKMKVHLLNYFFSVYHRCPRQFDGTLYLRCQTGNGNMLTCETKLFFCVGFPVILDPCIVVIFHSITIIHYGRSFKFWGVCVCVCVFSLVWLGGCTLSLICWKKILVLALPGWAGMLSSSRIYNGHPK